MLTSASHHPVAVTPEATTLWLADVRAVMQDSANPNDYADALLFLTPEERQRYAGFMRGQRRLEFLAARLLLRLAISRQLHIAATAIAVSVEPDGPAQLTLNGSTHDVPFFSLSHSAGIVACVVSQTRALGLDIEIHHPQRDVLALSETTFSPAEHAWLLAQTDRGAAFYRLWNSKEALYKLQCALQLPVSGLPDMIDRDGPFTTDGASFFIYPRPLPDLSVAICSTHPLSSVTCIPLFSFQPKPASQNGASIDDFFS